MRRKNNISGVVCLKRSKKQHFGNYAIFKGRLSCNFKGSKKQHFRGRVILRGRRINILGIAQ